MKTSLLLLSLSFLVNSTVHGQFPRPRSTDWMVECGHGLFTHYLSDNRNATITTPDQWNALVDNFNVTALAVQLASAGICYHIITIGQNSGFYLAPNPTYDSLTGYNSTTSKCSKRSLILDLAAAYAPYNIKLGVYLPSGAPCFDAQADTALNWTRSFPESIGSFNVSTGNYGTSGLDSYGIPWGMTSETDNSRMSGFQNAWNSIVADWSQGFGDAVHAWWIDGMYWPTQMYDFNDEPNFQSFGKALRSGNDASIIAFNPGQISYLPIESCEQDFTAGETADHFPTPAPRRTGNCGVQYHILSYLGQTWGERGSTPRFTIEQVYNMTAAYVASQWAITWDAPIDDNGLVEQSFIDIFTALGNITRVVRNNPDYSLPDRKELARQFSEINHRLTSSSSSGDTEKVIPTLPLLYSSSLPIPLRNNDSSTDYTVQVIPSVNYGTWTGWGTSLCWWTTVLGANTQAADLLWLPNSTVTINGQTVPTLGLSIARYNVGGSNNHTVNGSSIVLSPNYPWWKQLEGYWIDGASLDPTSPSWDWTADSMQRSALQLAIARGINSVELFSNSPMWYMLYNHNPSGSSSGSEDNLRPAYYEAHAQYMATVAAYAVQNWNVPLPITVEPFNEPIATWWKADGTQEGCHFDASTQQSVVISLANELKARNLTPQQVLVSASDESYTDMAVSTWEALNSTAKSVIDQVNVHGYEGTSGDRNGLYQQTVVQNGKILRMSEHGDGDSSGATMITNLLLDLIELHPTSWVYWQAFDVAGGWTLVQNNIPNNDQLNLPTPKYYALAQFSRHIRPNATIISTSSPGNTTVASYDPNRNVLVLVSVNTGNTDSTVTYNLQRFTRIPTLTNGNRWVTVMSNDGDKYQLYQDVNIDGTTKLGTAKVPANSVVTIQVPSVVV